MLSDAPRFPGTRPAMLGISAILLAACGLLIVFSGAMVRAFDARLNAAPVVSTRDARVLELHRRLWIADLHCDATLWNRPLLDRSSRGQVDLPRLRSGNVALQVFSLPNAYPLGANYRRTANSIDLLDALAVANRWPRATWSSPVDRALYQAEVVRRAVRDSAGEMVIVTNAQDLAGMVGATRPPHDAVLAILSIEGIHVRRDDMQSIDRLFESGVRIFGVAHMADNAVGGSAHGWRKYGLTEFGRRVVLHLDSLGAIIDLAHASESTIDDVLAASPRSVMVSHTGVDGTCPGERNLSDAHVARIAARGGIIGIGFFRGAVCDDDAAAIARAIRYAAGVGGIGAVALGSDFDGAVRTPFDAGGLVVLTEALLKEGFTDEEIARIMGLNVLEFFLRALPRED